jgi:hypothetical protein
MRAPRPLPSTRPSTHRCGARTAWASSPSATCHPYPLCRCLYSFQTLRRLRLLIRGTHWRSRRDTGGRGVVGRWYRTRTRRGRRRRRRKGSTRRRRAIRPIALLRRVAGRQREWLGRETRERARTRTRERSRERPLTGVERVLECGL